MKADAMQFSDRVRFNWGFHDGRRDAQDGRVRKSRSKWDSEYAAGYERGVSAFEKLGERPALSDDAWNEYKAA